MKEVQNVQLGITPKYLKSRVRTSEPSWKSIYCLIFTRLWLCRKFLSHDPIQRLQFSEHMLNIFLDDLAVIITAHEIHFHMNGHVNRQNCLYWAKETQRELHEKPLQSQRVTVWWALIKVGIIGLYFFKADSRKTVNSEGYVAMFQDFFYSLLGGKRMRYSTYVLSTGQSHCSYRESFNECHPRNICKTLDIQEWCYSVVSPLTWS